MRVRPGLIALAFLATPWASGSRTVQADDRSLERIRGRAPESLVIDIFETYESTAALEKQWRGPHGSPSHVTLVPTPGGRGRSQLAWAYDNQKYTTRASFTDRDPRPFDAFEFRVTPDGSGRILDFGVKNHAQKVFQTKGLLVMDGTQPVRVTVPFERLGSNMKDELVEEVWFWISGSAGPGKILIDDLAFTRDSRVLPLDSFEGYATNLAAFQRWRPQGLLADVQHVSLAREAGAFIAGKTGLSFKYDLPDVHGLSSYVDVDARGYTGLHFWARSPKVPLTLQVSFKNHAQGIWEAKPLTLPAGPGQAFDIPFSSLRVVAKLDGPRGGVQVIDEYLEQITIKLVGDSGEGVFFLDDVYLTRRP